MMGRSRSSRSRLSHSHESDDREEETASHDISQRSPQNMELPIQAFVPDYLRQIIFPCHGDFCQTPVFHPRLIAQLMAEGFLPIATDGILLPKLHRQRCVIRLPEGLRVRKSVRKKSIRFSLSVNRDFDAVIRGCHEQHGSSCWLVPPLVKSFRDLHQAGSTNAMLVTEGTTCPVRMYSVEVWNQEGKLVGGELGYTVGSIYTSLTGFCRQDGAGSVQLAALGRLLCESGFTLWDLGMDMEYKQELGSQLMPRSEFVQEVKQVRVTNGHVVLPTNQVRVNCRTIIDMAKQAPTNGQRSTAFVHPETRPTALIHPVHSSPVLDDKGSHKKARGCTKDC